MRVPTTWVLLAREITKPPEQLEAGYSETEDQQRDEAARTLAEAVLAFSEREQPGRHPWGEHPWERHGDYDG